MTRRAADTTGAAEEPAAVVRRAPFSDNPHVGARGLRTQQRILDAALEVFGEVGYDRCNIERIARAAGCSRVSFYQYFSDKPDVFRHLGGQVARQLRASTEALEPVTPDAAGWAALHAWVERYAAIYERYEPVFTAFPAAIEGDASLADRSEAVGEGTAARLQAKLTEPPLPPRQLAPALGLLLATVTRSLEVAALLRAVQPGGYDDERIAAAITDVVHRALFGLQPAVNAHKRAHPPLLAVPFGKPLVAMLAQADIADTHSLADKPALAALLDAGRAVLGQRGLHATRVDDIASAAGVSRGAFYRYFPNSDAFAQVLASRAFRTLSTAFVDIRSVEVHGPNGRADLRRWLQRYNTTHVEEAAMTRVWVDAALQDPSRTHDSAAVLDWGRRQLVALLDPGNTGDTEAEGLVLLALVEMYGGRPRRPAEIDAATTIIATAFFDRKRTSSHD